MRSLKTCNFLDLLYKAFFVECVARGLSVTEPTTPASVWRVVEARVCDASWAGGLVALRVESYSCPRQNRPRPSVSNEVRVVIAETAFGLPWHLSVTPFSRKVKGGGALLWVDLVYNCSLAGYGRRGTTACCGRPLEQG